MAAITVLPIIEAEAAFQIGYLTNLNRGDSYINLTNAGTLNGVDPDGRICVNVYTFDPAEELLSCCACPCRAGGLGRITSKSLTQFSQPCRAPRWRCGRRRGPESRADSCPAMCWASSSLWEPDMGVVLFGVAYWKSRSLRKLN